MIRVPLHSKLDNTSVAAIPIVLLVISVFFSAISSNLGTPRVIIGLGFLISICMLDYAYRKSIKLMLPIPVLFWLLFLLWVISNHFSNAIWMPWLQCFSMCFFVSWLLACSKQFNLMSLFLKCAAIAGLIFALGTIICCANPSVWEVLSSRLYGRLVRGVTGGVHAGLTSHYSTNAILISFGLIACFNVVLTSSRSKKYWIAALAFLVIGLLLTTKRAHIVFSIISITVTYLLYSKGNLGKAALRALIVALSLSIAFYIAYFYVADIQVVVDRFVSMRDDDTFSGRSGMYDICWTLWDQNKWFGNGMGSFHRVFYSNSLGTYYYSLGFTTMKAHNVYLQLLAEEGIVGLSIFILATACPLIITIRKIVGMPDPSDLLAVLGSLSIQIFFLLYCTTGNPLYDYQVYCPYIISICVGLVPDKALLGNRFLSVYAPTKLTER